MVKYNRCVVPNCIDTTSRRHRFPKGDSPYFQIWLRNVNNPKLNKLKPIDVLNYRVCEKHFTPDSLAPGTRRGLVYNAVPTQNLSVDLDSFADSPPEALSESDEEQPQQNCRLCLEAQSVHTGIFEKHNDSTIAELITSYLPQIKISKDDTLSKRICIKCLDKIVDFHRFATNCINNDRTQRQAVKRKPEIVHDYRNNKRNRLNVEFEEIQSELMKVVDEDVSNQIRDSNQIIVEVGSDGDGEDEAIDRVQLDASLALPSSEIVSGDGTDFQIIRDLDNTEFCIVDNFIFSFQLKKSNYCNLKCLTPNCPATGVHDLLTKEITIKIGHNHQPPSEYDRRKNIVLYVVRKKLQNDNKMLNIREIYNELCDKQPQIRQMFTLKTIMNQICSYKFQLKQPTIDSFDNLFDTIEDDCFEKLHFTLDNVQFYQEKFTTEDGSCKAIVFANSQTIRRFTDCALMYVDASFRINTKENFKYQLVTVLVWNDESYYPILFALINRKSQEIYRMIFNYLHNDLAPDLNPIEIITDYEANLYYALSEVYCNSNIGGSVFYYTLNLYKKACQLDLTKDLESDSSIRNIYHMLLMLPLLPVNTINDGLDNIEQQAKSSNLTEKLQPLFDYVKEQWIKNVTPDLFCVHRLENRINENVIAPFKKLRDFLMLTKSKVQRQPINIVIIVEKLIELEQFLQHIYNSPTKKAFARDLSSTQKKNVIKAWQFIENHPKINIVTFFTKVLGYIKCMENQLWIWGYYRYNPNRYSSNGGDGNDELISVRNFSVISTDLTTTENSENCVYPVGDVVIEAVIDENNELVLKNVEDYQVRKAQVCSDFQNSYLDYVIKK